MKEANIITLHMDDRIYKTGDPVGLGDGTYITEERTFYVKDGCIENIFNDADEQQLSWELGGKER